MEGLTFKLGPGEYRLFTSQRVELPIEPVQGKLNVEDQGTEFSFSPNPIMSGDPIQISGLAEPTLVDVYDAFGRLVLSENLDNGFYEVPISLNPGLYFIQAREEGLFDTQRLMVTDKN